MRKKRTSAIHHALGVTNVTLWNIVGNLQASKKTAHRLVQQEMGNSCFPDRRVTNSEQTQEIHKAGVSARFESLSTADARSCPSDKAARVFGIRNNTFPPKFLHKSSPLGAFPLI